MESVAFGTSRPKTANTIFLKISASTNYSNYISVGMCETVPLIGCYTDLCHLPVQGSSIVIASMNT